MSRVNELLLEEQDEEASRYHALAVAEQNRAQRAETEARLAQERDWACRHPAEWVEWVRLMPLLHIPIEFASSETYDFPRFLSDVGTRPSMKHVVQQRDVTVPYMQGNLVWVKAPATRDDVRPVDSPYRNVAEAARYLGMAPKTLLNHHSLGNVRSMPGIRPLAFKIEELDRWASTRRRPRTN